ncbi:hypothetical protein ACFWIX_08150 [Pseudarthrobacter sp. NPDC058362]|uniref:hypothetical protein n=1 Tax=Pseudarthrobacter sp. NPDC058362 TaxID=3346458 RepID=UPI0036565487
MNADVSGALKLGRLFQVVGLAPEDVVVIQARNILAAQWRIALDKERGPGDSGSRD